MTEKSYTCPCGNTFLAAPARTDTIRCPKCGHLIWYKTKTNLTKGNFDQMVEAAYEALEDGQVPFSGAR